MKVDRERFLLLAAAIATGVCAAPACGTSPAAPPNEPAPDPRPTAEPLVIPPIASARSMPVATASAAPSSEPPPEPAPVATGSPDPYKGTPVKAQACDPTQNKIGTSPPCVISGPGPTCESLNDTRKECSSLNALLKPRVAQAAIECLRRRSGTKEICEFNVTSICAYEALGSACLEPSAKVACDGVMKSCGVGAGKSNYNKMSRDSCEAGVSGIADGKRKKFISCITEMCRFETCLTYL